MSAVKLMDDIYWVGALDWNIRSFHGYTYSTPRGTTYNSYLILDEKVTLVDGVHAAFAEESFEKIRQIVPLETIDYVIVNHIEPDHSGSIPATMKYCPKAKVFGTAKCKEGLENEYHQQYDFQVVKTGDKISLGKRTLSFIEAPMIHWPDSMFSYCPEAQLLLPNDAFGQHYATSERFDDEVPEFLLLDEAAKYYANILWPFAAVILRKIEEIQKMNIPIKMIAPSH
ncbi:MAG: FprA family A-type flavoprotein, partial [Candidatus Omnitrophica bacterium]|nr:FprA family A-type flavoprotein [Candidatus Omnitrophota bacterium]